MRETPSTEHPTAGGDYAPAGKPLTGRRVALYFALFVATFVTANLVMLRMATTTFSGLVTTASFREGVKYDRELEAARAQDQRGWKVDAEVASVGQGRSGVTLRALDRDGKPLAGLLGKAKFSHPADARHDVVVDLKETLPGVYRGEGAPAPGAYTLILELERGGERLFLSRNRTSIGS